MNRDVSEHVVCLMMGESICFRNLFSHIYYAELTPNIKNQTWSLTSTIVIYLQKILSILREENIPDYR